MAPFNEHRHGVAQWNMDQKKYEEGYDRIFGKKKKTKKKRSKKVKK